MLSKTEILKTRQDNLLPTVTHYYREPLLITRASMQWVWDDQGRQYLDAFGGIVTVSAGHNHPRIKRRLQAWMDEDRPQHTTVFYLSEPMAELARKLVGRGKSGDSDREAGLAPSEISRAFFTNSGSESNELAILLSRQYTKKIDIVALKHAYHGGTTGTLSLGGQGTWKWGGPSAPGVVHAAQPNCYRCPWGATPDRCGLECAEDVEDTIRTTTSGNPAALIVEPIQGVGGFVIPPSDYIPRVYEIIKKYGGLYISDEVQTGVGRTGRYWWGVLHSGVIPDMITMAKGLGNGASIGALLTRDEIAESVRGKLHFNTFAGNPWASIQAAETLQILEEQDILNHAQVMGDRILNGLKEVQKSCPVIGDVRGRGLMIGIELVKDRKTKAYGTEEAVQLLEETRKRGLLIGLGGLHKNVIRITPPMCITADDADRIVKTIQDALEASPH